MDQAEQKRLIQQTFDTVATGYGSRAMRFFHDAAAELPALFGLAGHEQLLDVATGTGIALRALASRLPQGRVTGIDFSSGMLAQARQAVASAGLGNVELRQMDMQALEFDDRCFDVANCSFGVFFVEDMAGLLRHISAKLKPGGRLIASSFADDAFSPNVDLFLERIQQYGVEPPPFSWQRISSEAKLTALFEEAGLDDVQVYRKDVSYHLEDAAQWWEIVWNAGFRGLVAQLAPDRLEDFKQRHLADIGGLRSEQGIPLRIQVLYGVGHAG